MPRHLREWPQSGFKMVSENGAPKGPSQRGPIERGPKRPSKELSEGTIPRDRPLPCRGAPQQTGAALECTAWRPGQHHGVTKRARDVTGATKRSYPNGFGGEDARVRRVPLFCRSGFLGTGHLSHRSQRAHLRYGELEGSQRPKPFEFGVATKPLDSARSQSWSKKATQERSSDHSLGAGASIVVGPRREPTTI
ncbi:hypothetical protein M885DRAFT_66535 [Pelagophyceae sp. CCMP2097]|nr:hypothetical protein M885DRAFT_66535 [Pelagophyceae sp. CCMP2097]